MWRSQVGLFDEVSMRCDAMRYERLVWSGRIGDRLIDVMSGGRGLGWIWIGCFVLGYCEEERVSGKKGGRGKGNGKFLLTEGYAYVVVTALEDDVVIWYGMNWYGVV